jgi:hypothetical protein
MAYIDISAQLLGDKKMVAMLKDLSNDKVHKAIKAGVAVAARGAKKTISQQLKAGGLNLSSTRIKSGIEEPKFRASGMKALLVASSDPVTGKSFKAKQNARGLGVTFYKGQRHTIKGGFIGKYNGKPLARNPGGKRWPTPGAVRFITGPSISQAYLNGQKSGVVKPATANELMNKQWKGTKKRLDDFARGF